MYAYKRVDCVHVALSNDKQTVRAIMNENLPIVSSKYVCVSNQTMEILETGIEYF